MQLRWFGHIERMEAENWFSKCINLVIDGAAGWGRMCQVLQNDLQTLHLEKAFAQDFCDVWAGATNCYLEIC